MCTYFWSLFFLVAVATPPSYEKEIQEQNKVTEEHRQEDQKSFYQMINTKTAEVLKYLRESREGLRKNQEQIRKNFEDQLKTEKIESQKKQVQATAESWVKSSNEKRRTLFEKFNNEKKQLNTELEDYKKQFDGFVKKQKENFQQQIKILSAKIQSAKQPPALTPLQQEFREIPPGPGTPLKAE